MFASSDGHFTLAIVSDRHFELLCDAIEREDLAEAYPSNAARMEDRESLIRKLARVFKTEPTEYWMELFEQAGLPVGRVMSIPEAFDDPQARYHGMLVEFEHPAAGHVRTTGSPLRLDGAQARATSLPPLLGQHTRAILGEMGVDQETIETMVREGRAVAP